LADQEKEKLFPSLDEVQMMRYRRGNPKDNLRYWLFGGEVNMMIILKTRGY